MIYSFSWIKLTNYSQFINSCKRLGTLGIKLHARINIVTISN